MGVEGGEGSLRPSTRVLLARRCLGAQPGCLESKHGHPSGIRYACRDADCHTQYHVSCSEQGKDVLSCGM